MKSYFAIATLVVGLCSCSSTDTIQIGENTFVHKSKVYRIVDNEVTTLGELDSDSIRQFQVLKPTKRDFGKSDLSYVKDGAFTSMDALFRGNTLYYNLYIRGINDLRDNYNNGNFTIQFEDKFGFIIHAIAVATSDLTRVLGSDNETVQYFRFDGKTDMSSDIYKAIDRYSVSSSVRQRTKNSYWNY